MPTNQATIYKCNNCAEAVQSAVLSLVALKNKRDAAYVESLLEREDLGGGLRR